MPSLADISVSAVAGVRLAFAFHPMFALVGAVGAAILWTLARDIRRSLWGFAIATSAWVVGDGAHISERLRGLVAATGRAADPLAAGDVTKWLALSIWALGGLSIGYLLPAWLGAFAGRRVTHGTGWLSAIAVATGASLALSALARVM